MGLPRSYTRYISYDMNENTQNEKLKLNPSANLLVPNINSTGFKPAPPSLHPFPSPLNPPAPPPPVPPPPPASAPPPPAEAVVIDPLVEPVKKVIKSEVKASLTKPVKTKAKPSGLLMFFDLLVIGVSVSLSIYFYFLHV